MSTRNGSASFLKLLNKPRVERTVEFPTDYEAVEALPAAERAVAEAQNDLTVLGDDPARRSALAAAERDLKALRDRVAKSTITCRFQALPSAQYEALGDAHRASDDEKADSPFAKSFAPALIAASLVEPKLSEEEAAQLYESWSQSEANALFSAAIAVNVQRPMVDLGKGSRPTRATARS